jgi:hypothetical protein
MRSKNSYHVAEREHLKRAIEVGEVSRNYLGDDYLNRYVDPNVSFKSSFQDPFWPLRYVGNSLYSHHLNKVPLESSNVLLIFMDDIIRDTRGTLRKISKLINVGLNKDIPIPHENKTKIRPKWLLNLKNKLKSVLGSSLANIISDTVFEDSFMYILSDIIYNSKTHLEQETVYKLCNILNSEYDYLNHMTTKDNFTCGY